MLFGWGARIIAMRPMPATEDLVMGYPNLRALAQILDVSPSTLSSRRMTSLPAGNEKRFSPATALEAADYFRRRPLRAVADALITHARDNAPTIAYEVADEVERMLAHMAPVADELTVEGTLKDARAFLPSDIYEKIEALLKSGEMLTIPGSIGPSALEPDGD